MNMQPEEMPHQYFRHRQAVANRLQRCVVDKLTLYTTLAYCSNCLQWAIGERAIPDRPSEYYNRKAITALKYRLADPDPALDQWLILSIYALGVSDMWARNYDAATSHMQILRHFVLRFGGMKKLDPYLMESLILGDRYLAVGKFASPMLPFDWDPGAFSKQGNSPISSADSPGLGPAQLAKGFFELDHGDLHLEILEMVGDILESLRFSHYLNIQKRTRDPKIERWLFLRHQAIIYRLLQLPTMSGSIQECCRIALMIWLLKITAYHGAARVARGLLTRLADALGSLCSENPPTVPGLKLLFWIHCLGAMTAEYTAERDWFLRRTLESARILGVWVEKDEFWKILEQFLVLNSEGGLQFARMVRAVERMRDEDDGILCQ